MTNINSNTRNDGFSLIELMVVISIIVILMAIIVGIYLSAKGRRDEKKVRSEMNGISNMVAFKHIEVLIKNRHINMFIIKSAGLFNMLKCNYP